MSKQPEPWIVEWSVLELARGFSKPYSFAAYPQRTHASVAVVYPEFTRVVLATSARDAIAQVKPGVILEWQRKREREKLYEQRIGAKSLVEIRPYYDDSIVLLRSYETYVAARIGPTCFETTRTYGSTTTGHIHRWFCGHTPAWRRGRPEGHHTYPPASSFGAMDLPESIGDTWHALSIFFADLAGAPTALHRAGAHAVFRTDCIVGRDDGPPRNRPTPRGSRVNTDLTTPAENTWWHERRDIHEHRGRRILLPEHAFALAVAFPDRWVDTLLDAPDEHVWAMLDRVGLTRAVLRPYPF